MEGTPPHSIRPQQQKVSGERISPSHTYGPAAAPGTQWLWSWEMAELWRLRAALIIVCATQKYPRAANKSYNAFNSIKVNIFYPETRFLADLSIINIALPVRLCRVGVHKCPAHSSQSTMWVECHKWHYVVTTILLCLIHCRDIEKLLVKFGLILKKIKKTQWNFPRSCWRIYSLGRFFISEVKFKGLQLHKYKGWR